MANSSSNSSPTSLAEGDVAEADVYAVYGNYEDVADVDGSLVNIAKDYPSTVYATELKENERGNLLVARGDTVSAKVAALLAG